MLPSGSVRSHSWVLVYFRSAGTLLILSSPFKGFLFNQGLAESHERRLHYPRVQELAADVHLNLLDGAGRHASESYRALESRRKRTAGDLAGAYTGDRNLLVTTEHAAIFQQQANEFARRALRLYFLERLATDETPLAIGARR